MELTRVFDLLDHQKAKYPKPDALAQKVGGNWITTSTDEYARQSDLVSLGLLAMGIKKGDKLATLTNNRTEWNFLDMGILQTGAIHVPIYPTLSIEDYEYILVHAEIKYMFISDALLYKKLKPLIDKIPAIEKVYTINQVEGVANWQDIPDLGAKSEHLREVLNKTKKEVSPEDLASIIYTSGTTGVSKGVMLTHHNFVSNLLSARNALPLDNTHKILSFLPLCHVYEHLLSYLFQYKGVSIYYAQNMGTIISDLKEIKADGFDTVPRLLEKVYATIMNKGKELKGIKRAIFDWSVNLGLRFDFTNGPLYFAQLAIARKLVFVKWQEALGGHVKFIGSGGAALQPRLARLFWAAGIPVQEGYGLTETSPLIAFNYSKHPGIKFGTVGPVIENVEVKIADDGEILVRGFNVMKGYYKNDELTAEVIKDGWFHTGDIGEFVNGKYLKITDRKKEIFKLSSGKYIAPQVLENKLKESAYIEQAMIVGENKKYAAAIIVPDQEGLTRWGKEHHIQPLTLESLIENPKVKQLIQDEIKAVNKKLGKTEEIKKFKLIKDSWTPESGDLSPTLKLKRKHLAAKYESFISDMFPASEND